MVPMDNGSMADWICRSILRLQPKPLPTSVVFINHNAGGVEGFLVH